MRRILVPAALGLALVACQDQSPEPVPNVTPAFASQPNPHFFFLPPLAPTPTTTGTFNDNFYPAVEICYLDATRTACDATKALLGTFTRDFGTFNEKIFVVSGQHYGLDWSTSLFGIQNGKYVRLTVRAGLGSPIIFGEVDLYLDTNGKNLAAAPANGAVGVRNGSTLAVKFRIEDGALCGGNPECEEGFLTPAGGTFTLPDGTAGLQADAGDVQSGSANVVIERYRGPDACLPTDYPQYEACIRIQVLGTITITPGALIDVGFCLEADGTDYLSELELGKWDEVNPVITDLAQTDVSDFVTCAQFSSAPQAQGQLAKLARATGKLLKPFASVFGVKEAYAAGPGPIPFGGGTSDFSRFGAYRPLNLTKVSGDNVTTGVGLSVTPTVKVTSRKTGAAASGIPVSFNVLSGAGSVTPASATTDLNGLASASWAFGLGSNSLRVKGINPLAGLFPNQPAPGVWGNVVFNGTGVDLSTLKAVILPPIGRASDANPAKYVTGIPATVSICHIAAGTTTCGAPNYGPFPLVDDGSKYQGAWNTPSDLVTGDIYRITVTLAGSVVLTGSSVDIMPLAGGKAKNLNTGEEFSFQVGSNQPLKYSIEYQ